MQEAMDYKVKTMALILSWDNTTTKGISGAHADYVVAWTRTMRDELTKYHDIPSSNIYIGGVAQYDEYFKKSNLLSKDELVGQLNLSVDKKNIFFCLESPTSYKHNSDILRILAKNIMNKSIDCRCQLIARIHPIYFRIENESYRFESELRELNDIKTEFPFIVFDYPETLSKKMSFDMPITETYKLGALLQHSDVVLCFYSSMSIESCIFDTPVINIELFDRETIPNNIIGNHAHNKRVLNTNGVRHASTERELVSAINNYIENPSLNSAERKMIVENETGPNKGCAAANIANHILSIL